MKKIFLTTLIIILNVLVFAQKPNWTKYLNRSSMYPEQAYVKGFSSEINHAKIDVNKLLNRCIENAKKELIESITVSIKSVTVSGISNVSTGVDEETVEYLKHSSISYSNIELSNLKTETYYDKRKNTAFAFTYVKKSKLISFYKQKVIDIVLKIEQNLKFALDAKASNLKQKSYLKLLKTLTKFREVEEAQTILVALGVSNENAIKREKIVNLKSNIDKEINLQSNSIKNSISDLSFFISQGFKLQKPKIKGNVSLSVFNYQDTKFGSPFSKILFDNLEQKLISNSKYDIININEFNGDVTKKNIDYIITGNYWEEKKFLKVISVLRNLKTGKAIASVESKLSKDYFIKNDIAYLPENFTNANSKFSSFSKNEVIGGDLSLEVWTSKGNKNLLFQENDILNLYVRVNKKCYVRFIYHLADGSSALLLDDYYIGTDKINKVYKLPQDFICSPPFGAEVLQVNAQTEKFPPLVTKKQYGYDFITEDLDSVIEKNRGFKKNNDEVMKAENRLVITTMAK